MFTSKKIAAVAAGVLGGFALMGAGAVQALADEAPGRCADDGRGNLRCVQVNDFRATTGKDGNLRVVNDTAQTCSGAGSGLSCVSGSAVGGGKS